MRRNRQEVITARAQKACDDWNANVPIGADVTVWRDNGSILETRTRSVAWVICDHASVLVEGISGGYSLERVARRAATPENR